MLGQVDAVARARLPAGPLGLCATMAPMSTSHSAPGGASDADLTAASPGPPVSEGTGRPARGGAVPARGDAPPARRGVGEVLRHIGRWALGLSLLNAGIGHLTHLRQEFQAQVPPWLPLDPDFVVVASGVVEILLGVALVLAPRRFRPALGWIVAVFFVAVFPGNISQYVTQTDGFGLDTDQARFTRLFFQPVLVLWALWSTSAWRDRRRVWAQVRGRR